MQRRLPLLCESFVSQYLQAPPLSQLALQWESLQVLTLSGGGQSQVRDLLLGYHQISGWGRQRWVALSFRVCHVILFICRQLFGRQKGYLAHTVVMKHIKILKPAMLSIGSSTWHMSFFLQSCQLSCSNMNPVKCARVFGHVEISVVRDSVVLFSLF